jgi:putative lipoprotein
VKRGNNASMDTMSIANAGSVTFYSVSFVEHVDCQLPRDNPVACDHDCAQSLERRLLNSLPDEELGGRLMPVVSLDHDHYLLSEHRMPTPSDNDPPSIPLPVSSSPPMQVVYLLFLAVLVAIPPGCGERSSEQALGTAQPDNKPQKKKVTATLEFTGEAGFEADTVARVMLLDISYADAPSKLVGEQAIKDLKQFPIPFEIEYDPAIVKHGITYALGVRIETKDRLDYSNEWRTEVLSHGMPSTHLKVPVSRVQR